MTSLIRAIIQALVAPEHQLSCSTRRWAEGLSELRRRGKGYRESGAFLLGRNEKGKRHVSRFIYYDDLEPQCLDSGVVIFDGSGYGPLWQTCRETGMNVIADIHTHPGLPFQSQADRKHPMVAVRGHIALIVPNLAKRCAQPSEIGIYEYSGDHNWLNRSGEKAARFFYIGIWG